MLELNSPFPAFNLPDQNEKMHSLEEYAGQWLIVYFYPKDNTSGCSLEAKAFADAYSTLQQKGVQVLGVSPDSVKSHDKFACKLELPFPLLSDTEHSLLEKAGVWQKKKMYGREYMGVVRTTALIDPKGIVRAIWPKVKVAGHVEEVSAKLHELAG